MKSSTNLIRVAAMVALIQYFGHAFLFLKAKPQNGQDEINLIEAMKSHHWNFSGFDHSYWDFYFGYGLLAILYGIVEIALLFLLSSLSKTDAFRLRPVIAVLILANIIHAALVINYFFLLPAIFDLIVALVLCVAILATRRSVSA